MPLSEHEERILAEIERQLAAEDPRFVARARRTPRLPRSFGRTARLRIAVAMAVVGALSLFGLVFDIVFGAIGMALLFGAILLGASAVRERSEPQQQASVPPDELT
jgi:hypothetical protein